MVFEPETIWFVELLQKKADLTKRRHSLQQMLEEWCDVRMRTKCNRAAVVTESMIRGLRQAIEQTDRDIAEVNARLPAWGAA